MSVTVHQRPGVYSSYDASSVVSGSGAGGIVGLAGVNTTAKAGEVKIITSYDQAVTAFGGEGAEGMAELVRLALRNGASAVAAVAEDVDELTLASQGAEQAEDPVSQRLGKLDSFAPFLGVDPMTLTDAEIAELMRGSRFVNAASYKL